MTADTVCSWAPARMIAMTGRGHAQRNIAEGPHLGRVVAEEAVQNMLGYVALARAGVPLPQILQQQLDAVT